MTFNDDDAGIGLLEWTVGDSDGYVDESVKLEIVLSSTITDANATTSGTIVANLMKFSYANSADTPFNLRSQADIEVIEPEVDLVKGIERITRGVTVVEGPNCRSEHRRQTGDGR